MLAELPPTQYFFSLVKYLKQHVRKSQTMPKKPNIELIAAKKKDLATVLDLVLVYFKKNGRKADRNLVQHALFNLLKKDSTLGAVWLVDSDNKAVGFVIATYGYSFPFGGIDASIREFYLPNDVDSEETRSQIFSDIKKILRKNGVKALHLYQASNAKGKTEFAIKKGNFDDQTHILRSSCVLD